MSSNSTCFGLIWAHHQEVQQYVYSSWYLEFFLDDCLLSLICCLSSVVCCLSSVVCCLLSVVCRLLSVVCRLLSVVCSLSSVVCCLSSIVCCLLSVVCCLLSVVCCLSSVVCCLSSFVLVVPNQPAQKTTDSHLKRIVSTYCSTHTDVPPDDGPRYARNM